MLVMAPQTFQLNVKTFAQLYQVKIQGAVDTIIVKHSVVRQGWKNREEGKGMLEPWAETQALARKLPSQIILTFISTPKKLKRQNGCLKPSFLSEIFSKKT